jgi:predicted transcriptional regulator
VVERNHHLPPLGDLELAALELLWDVDEVDVLQAHRALGRRRGISVNTVGSALERLHRKGLVKRRKVSHAYRYQPAVTRDVFQARRLANAVGGVQALADAGVLSAFVDLVAGADDEALDTLEALIAQRRATGER